MGFLISLQADAKFEAFDELCVRGEFFINDFREQFNAPVEVWSVNDYKNHWLTAIGQLAANPAEDKFVLVLSMRDPRKSEIIACLTLYPMEDTVFIQNHIIFCEGKETLIEGGHFSRLMHDRETGSEDGAKISEWSASREDVLEFGRKLKAGI